MPTRRPRATSRDDGGDGTPAPEERPRDLEALQQYESMRDFGKTPEPAPHLATGEGALTFVVQKHRATALHYDLRLEFGGTMKSWPIPRGPSTNTSDKRLAMMTEDHPLSY